MKKIVLAVMAFCAFGVANAQDDEGGFKVGIHLGMPIGDAGDAYKFNFGTDVAYMWPISDGFLLGATTGYSYLSGEEQTFMGTTIAATNGAFIPVAASAQYSLTESFFVGADLGYALYAGDGDGEGGLYYQPKVGYQMEKIELYLSYKAIADEVSAITIFGIGAAYKF
ncbi:MAG TPA: outer membrane beta-barrel protein [Flavobacterium sp.]|nr:outer membrane beta-barrel protein [Flavobacterium sp.]